MTARPIRLASWIASVFLLTLFPATLAAGEKSSVPIGAQIADLEFKDIRYLPRSLADLGDAKAIVLVFTTLDGQQNYLAPLKEIDEQYRDRGAQIVLLYEGPDDDLKQIAAVALGVEAKFTSAKDVDGKCAAICGVTNAGQAVVLDGQRRLKYRGRIDDRWGTKGDNSDPTTHELADAIDAVLNGADPKVAETPPSGGALPTATATQPPKNINYADHIAPIMAQHCATCHHPGTEAPFSVLSFEEVDSHAEMIGEVVGEGRMPPWYASFGEFSNGPAMTAAEKELIRQWVAAGRPPGDLRKVPAPPAEFTAKSDWTIDKPDLVIEAPKEHELPADGYVPYEYVLLKHQFKHDTWIQQCEILPDNPRVVHHCNMAYIEGGFDWKNAKFVLGRVPGVQPMKFEQGVAFKIPKGAVLLLQIHYTTTGKPEKCRMRVGMRFARDVVQKEFHYLWMVNTTFAIPPGDPLHRVEATSEMPVNAQALGAFAHMHFRGRDMTFTALYPDGRREKLLEIPNYSFDWQLAYRWRTPKDFPKGTKIECVSHYDNSTFNPYNPDPTATVREGQQTFEEMLNGVMFYLDKDEQLNLRVDPKTGAPVK